jgi:hypothetical protein
MSNWRPPCSCGYKKEPAMKKPIVRNCYLSVSANVQSDSLLDMAVGKTPDGSILLTMKGESLESDTIITLTPTAAEWLENAIRYARQMKT